MSVREEFHGEGCHAFKTHVVATGLVAATAANAAMTNAAFIASDYAIEVAADRELRVKRVSCMKQVLERRAES